MLIGAQNLTNLDFFKMKTIKKIILLILLALILVSCSKENLTYSAKLNGGFALPEIELNGATYAEIDVNGETIVIPVNYVPHGVRSEAFELPKGWNEVTRVELFNGEGITHYVKPLDSLNTLNGLVITGVPFKTRGDVTVQLFEIE